MSSSASALDPLVMSLLRGESVLDVGCGYGRFAALISANYWESRLARKPVIDGVDAFLPNVRYCAKLPYYRRVWQSRLPQRLEGSWDTVLAIEVIEHVAQKDVSRTLDLLEAAAKKRVILSTPNWPAYRGGGHTDLGYNKYEAHLSYVSRKLLRKRGYKLIGVGFGNPGSWWVRLLQAMAPKHATAKSASGGHEPQAGAFSRLRMNFESLARMFPSQGKAVLAYKDVGR